MKCTVGLAVTGNVYIEVEADNFEEAKEKALDIFADMDFGQLEDIEGEAVNAEDENRRFKKY